MAECSSLSVEKKKTWLIWCCAIFSRVSTCNEKGGEATQVGQWWLNATPLHRLWFIIEGIAQCHTSRHLRSHYHAAPGSMTQTEPAVRGRCIPLWSLLDQNHLAMLLSSLRCFSANLPEISFLRTMVTNQANHFPCPNVSQDLLLKFHNDVKTQNNDASFYIYILYSFYRSTFDHTSSLNQTRGLNFKCEWLQYMKKGANLWQQVNNSLFPKGWDNLSVPCHEQTVSDFCTHSMGDFPSNRMAQ